MKISSAGVLLIKQHEQCRLKPYKATKNEEFWTVGWGHYGADVQPGVTITQAQADSLLETDLLWADATVSRCCPEATQGQHDALVSLCFNIGGPRFSTCTAVKRHNEKEWGRAAQAIQLWNKQKGQTLQELVQRRAEEATMYLTASPAPKADVVDVCGKADGEKPLTASRVVNGGTVTAVTTTAGVGVSALKESQDALAYVSEALGGVVQYLPQIGYLLAAAAIGGVLLTLYGRWQDRHEGRA